MAYRRKQGGTVMGRSLTFKEELYPRSTTSSSLAARAIMASAAHRESSLSQGITSRYDHGYTSMGSSNEGAGSYWGVLARKAITILKDDNQPTIGNTLEEGGSIVDTQNSADFIEETRKIQIRRKGMMNDETWQHSANQTSQEDQIKASRDVAMATAAKAKVLLRELRTVKADLAFAKERCSQLEEENKSHRESREKGVNIAADDDMIRLQLETLLAEKARLAHENSVYARENRFLREIVEYHQLTMQDVLYLNEGFEDGTEDDQVYSSMSPPRSPTTISRISSSSSLSRTSSLNKEMQLPKTTPTSAAIPVPSPH